MYWFKNNEKSTDYKILYFSFLFLGFSLGTKYLTLVSLILYSLILTFILIKINKIPLLKTITIVCIANSLAFSIALPYFTKNIAYTHNPVFPFIFSENVSYGYNGISYEGISGLLNYYWNLFFGRDFLFKPMFYKGATSFGFLIIAFLPSFLLDKKNRITLGYFLIIWFIYSIIMFFISDPQPRHFLNSIPLLIIPGAAGMYSLFVQKNIFRICFFGIFILSVFIDLRERTNIFIFSQSRVVFGKESQDAYLERYLFSHPEHLNSDMMIFIKNNLDKDSKILTLYFCNAFYVDRIMTTDYNLENKFIYHEKNIGKFLGKLGELGITHVYLSDSDYMRREDLWKKTFAETLILNDDFKNTYLELVFSSCDQHLFRINYTP